MLTTFKQFNESKGGKMSIIWHASPNSNLFKLRATGSSKKLQAIPMEEAGLYVCPRFRDAVIWFLSYISGKKNNYSSLNPYKEGTIYKLEIPTVVLERSWYSENWEPEYFISEDDVKYIKILSKKTFSIKELKDLYQECSKADKNFAINISNKREREKIRTNYALLVLEELKSKLNSMLLKKGFKNSNIYLELIEILKFIEDLEDNPDRS